MSMSRPSTQPPNRPGKAPPIDPTPNLPRAGQYTNEAPLTGGEDSQAEDRRSPGPHPTQHGDDPTPPSPRASDWNNYFGGSSGNAINTLQITHTSGENNTVIVPNSRAPHPNIQKGWDKLADRAAPNALFDAMVRFGPHLEDTKTPKGLVGDILAWIKDPQSPIRAMCVTGPAGAGKTALQQAVSEACANVGIFASFFFSSPDTTRNMGAAFISTIAYQLGMDNEELRHLMAARVLNDPLIFSKRLEYQATALVVDPMKRSGHGGGPESAPPKPVAILVDGIDECKEEDQPQVLEAIRVLIAGKGDCTPFRVLFTSKGDHFRHSLESDGMIPHGPVCHIQLEKGQNAQWDIGRTLERKLWELQASLGHANDLDHAVVEAGSGRYMHVANIVRYITSQCRTLDSSKVWTAIVGTLHPQDTYHQLYRRILLSARDEFGSIPQVPQSQPFMLLLMLYASFPDYKISPYSHISKFAQDLLLGLPEGTCEALTKNVNYLVLLSAPPGPKTRWGPRISFYHKSCQSFLENGKLSNDLHVSKVDIQEYFVAAFLRYFIGNVDLATSSLEKKGYFPYETVTFLTHMSIYHVAVILNPRQGRADSELISKIIPCIREFTKADGWGF